MKKITTAFAFSKIAVAISVSAATTAFAAEQLETVIVTANKIETDIQQTAVSMQSISGDKLTDLGASSVQDIAKFTPGLQLEQTGGGITATVRIRGIGTPGLSALDPSIPVFIDGVAQARTGSGFQDLLDISRVEVLRGPQGTLYGRNSTAGAINVWTKDANSHRWEGSVQAQLGNYNDREVKGTVNIPLVDDLLAARVSAFSVKQDGYVKNAMTGNTANGDADRFGGRAKVLLTPSSDFSIQWLTDYSNSTTHPGATLVRIPALYTEYATTVGILSQGGLRTFPQDDAYNGKIYANIDQLERDTNFATSVTVNWDIDNGPLKGASFTSITAYDLYKAYQLSEQDNSILDYGIASGPADTNSWSQEFRLSSDAGNLEYVTGLYYYADRLVADQDTNNALPDAVDMYNHLGFTAFGGQPADARTHDWFNSDNAAIFGQATYNFSEKFSLTAGLRESWAQKRGNSSLNALTSTGIAINSDIVDHATLVETDTSGVLKARYFVDNNIMLYTSYDRGFKPGGFNRVIFNDGTIPTSYHKEVSNNYEVGAKTQWFNNRLQANISAFYMEFKGYHYQMFDNSKDLIVENLPKTTTDGVELDLQALVASELTVGAGAAYINPRIRETNPQNERFDHLSEGQLLSDASQYSTNLNAEYSHRLIDNPASLFARVDVSYRSRYILGDYADGNFQGGYTLTNLRFGVRNLDEHWQLTGWVKNLFDKEYASPSPLSSNMANQHDGLMIYQGAPRTYGITAQYDY